MLYPASTQCTPPDMLLPAAETRQPAWEPRSLPKIEQSARVKVGELVVGIGFSLVAILVLNAYPQWISAIMIKDGQVTSLPLLSVNASL